MKLTTAVALLTMPFGALADPGRRPPAEAIEACSSLIEDAACSFSLGGEGVDGVCTAGPTPELPLACLPEDAPPPPPQVAFEACEALVVDEVCEFSHQELDITGTCSFGPEGDGELACKPSRPPGPKAR